MKSLFSRLLMVSLWPAAAAAMPAYDIEASCRHAAMVTATLSQEMIDTCIANEQAALERLLQHWYSTPDDKRERCLETMKRLGPSYILLDACLDRGG